MMLDFSFLDDEIPFNYDPLTYIPANKLFFEFNPNEEPLIDETIKLPITYDVDKDEEIDCNCNLLQLNNDKNQNNFNFSDAYPQFLTGSKYMNLFARKMIQDSPIYIKTISFIVIQCSKQPIPMKQLQLQLD